MKNVMGEHFSGGGGQITWGNCTGGNYVGGNLLWEFDGGQFSWAQFFCHGFRSMCRSLTKIKKSSLTKTYSYLPIIVAKVLEDYPFLLKQSARRRLKPIALIIFHGTTPRLIYTL